MREVFAPESMAGNELTEFASLYPRRVMKLVYLDAAYDLPENAELGRKLNLPPLPGADNATLDSSPIQTNTIPTTHESEHRRSVSSSRMTSHRSRHFGTKPRRQSYSPGGTTTGKLTGANRLSDSRRT
jgi:hypothetical protein